MKQFTICYALTGNVTIEAETEDEASELFGAMELTTLYDNVEGPSDIVMIVQNDD